MVDKITAEDCRRSSPKDSATPSKLAMLGGFLGNIMAVEKEKRSA